MQTLIHISVFDIPKLNEKYDNEGRNETRAHNPKHKTETKEKKQNKSSIQIIEALTSVGGLFAS